nr:MAG TPA: head to tail adaptor [Caudoviricetes sp.]
MLRPEPCRSPATVNPVVLHLMKPGVKATSFVSCAGCDMYCTLEDLLEQVPERTLIELTSEEMDFDSPATVNTRVVESCIRYADELIDAHLRGRYILPLAEIPTVLRDIAITLVRYRLYARRPEGDLPDTVKDDHKEALRQLKELRDNRLTLGLPSTQKDMPEPGEFRVRSRPATFGGRDGLLEKY